MQPRCFVSSDDRIHTNLNQTAADRSFYSLYERFVGFQVSVVLITRMKTHSSRKVIALHRDSETNS